jgi:hypothetical protein
MCKSAGGEPLPDRLSLGRVPLGRVPLGRVPLGRVPRRPAAGSLRRRVQCQLRRRS